MEELKCGTGKIPKQGSLVRDCIVFFFTVRLASTVVGEDSIFFRLFEYEWRGEGFQ